MPSTTSAVNALAVCGGEGGAWWRRRCAPAFWPPIIASNAVCLPPQPCLAASQGDLTRILSKDMRTQKCILPPHNQRDAHGGARKRASAHTREHDLDGRIQRPMLAQERPSDPGLPFLQVFVGWTSKLTEISEVQIFSGQTVPFVTCRKSGGFHRR